MSTTTTLDRLVRECVRRHGHRDSYARAALNRLRVMIETADGVEIKLDRIDSDTALDLLACYDRNHCRTAGD